MNEIKKNSQNLAHEENIEHSAAPILIMVEGLVGSTVKIERNILDLRKSDFNEDRYPSLQYLSVDDLNHDGTRKLMLSGRGKFVFERCQKFPLASGESIDLKPRIIKEAPAFSMLEDAMDHLNPRSGFAIQITIEK